MTPSATTGSASAKRGEGLRVTFVLHTYPKRPIGGFRVVYEHASRLVARGHDVAVVHPRRLANWDRPAPRGIVRRLARLGSDVRDALVAPDVGWHPVDPRVRLSFVPDLDPARVPDADAVVATYWATAEAVLGYPPSKGRKLYLIQHHEVFDADPERVNATWRAPLRKMVIAEWLRRTALDLGVDASEVAHVPNGVDTRLFPLLSPIEGRPPRVAMMHSEIPWKASADGIRALEEAKAAEPRLEAVLFGKSRRPRGLPDWIVYRVRPSHRALVDLYNSCAVYLCPSLTEGWHLPPVEAMACGAALVSTAIGGVADYAAHGETALLSPPREPSGLAANLVRLLASDGERIALARRGRERALSFTWERSADAFESVLLDEVARGAGGV